jgi:hypothetical protein
MPKEQKDRLAMMQKQIIDLSRISGALAGLAFGVENQNTANFIMDLHNALDMAIREIYEEVNKERDAHE